MEKEKLRAIQMVQLSIMDDIHRVCVKNNLRYYLIGGSALGAIRHEGFIPWDIDIDIAMPRPDYESFIHQHSAELNTRFSCVHFELDANCYSPHALVVLKNSIMIHIDTALNPHLKSFGIYVDILPLDKCPDDEKSRQRQAKALKCLKEIRSFKIGKKYPSDSILKRLRKDIIRNIFKIIPDFIVYNKQQKLIQKYDDDFENTNALWCSMLSHYKYEKLCMERSVFGKPKLVKFENREYYVPEKTIDYLSHLFGDWMKLPPVEQQLQLSNYILSAQW